jgi:hypothetical protein
MRYARTRLKHEARETTDRNLYPYTSVVDEHKRTINYVHLAILQEDDSGPVLQANRPKGDVGPSCHFPTRSTRRISISPHPKALALPKPR